jgi:uncharacterized phiE125 gp8 family phage protein
MAPLGATYETIAVPTGRMAIPGPMDWQSCHFPADCRGDVWGRVAPLGVRPVSALISVEALSSTGTRSALAENQYTTRIDGEGQCAIRIPATTGIERAVIRFTAGLALDWSTLPESLRHGIMRLAAHQYRQRESAGADALPPASVTALWRPWRRMRMA